MASAAVSAVDSRWFATWFDSDQYHELYSNRNDAEAAGFITELVRLLRPMEGAEVLDLGCGAGRHAKCLASKGLQVTGIDLAESSIRRAKRWERPGLQFFRHDMRVPFGRNKFDQVFNLFTSFGYFEVDEHEQVVGNMAAALKPGGTLVLDYLNVRYAEAHLVREEEKVVGDVRYRLTRWTNATHVFKRIRIERQGENAVEHVEQVAKFTVEDFERMFALHGLTLEDVRGNYELGAYDVNVSQRMILIARKPGGVPDAFVCRHTGVPSAGAELY